MEKDRKRWNNQFIIMRWDTTHQCNNNNGKKKSPSVSYYSHNAPQSVFYVLWLRSIAADIFILPDNTITEIWMIELYLEWQDGKCARKNLNLADLAQMPHHAGFSVPTKLIRHNLLSCGRTSKSSHLSKESSDPGVTCWHLLSFTGTVGVLKVIHI